MHTTNANIIDLVIVVTFILQNYVVGFNISYPVQIDILEISVANACLCLLKQTGDKKLNSFITMICVFDLLSKNNFST